MSTSSYTIAGRQTSQKACEYDLENILKMGKIRLAKSPPQSTKYWASPEMPITGQAGQHPCQQGLMFAMLCTHRSTGENISYLCITIQSIWRGTKGHRIACAVDEALRVASGSCGWQRDLLLPSDPCITHLLLNMNQFVTSPVAAANARTGLSISDRRHWCSIFFLRA